MVPEMVSGGLMGSALADASDVCLPGQPSTLGSSQLSPPGQLIHAPSEALQPQADSHQGLGRKSEVSPADPGDLGVDAEVPPGPPALSHGRPHSNGDFCFRRQRAAAHP